MKNNFVEKWLSSAGMSTRKYIYKSLQRVREIEKPAIRSVELEFRRVITAIISSLLFHHQFSNENNINKNIIQITSVNEGTCTSRYVFIEVWFRVF